MINCFYDCYTILNKVYGEKAFLKQAILDTAIEEKNRRMTVKICYGVLDNDIRLGYYIAQFTDKLPKAAIRTILKIAMYAMEDMNKAPYAVIDNAVELTKRLGKRGACGFVNAFLRRFSREKIAFPNDPAERLSVRYSYPAFAVRMLTEAYGAEAEAIMASANKKTALRFPAGCDGADYLKERGVLFERTPVSSVFLAEHFARDAGYDRGEYTFQSVGSAAICAAVEPCARLLDACAAPGGKSVNLSEKCGEVLSFDLHPHRVELIRQYAERMKRKNIEAKVWESSVHDPALDDCFDAVLCDVPCSGFGVVNDNPDIKLNREETSLPSLNQMQAEILETCSRYVRPGGMLYYATCSVFPCENQDIVSVFLSRHPEFSPAEVESALPHVKISEGMLQFLPHISLGGGYFLAKLKRQ